MKTQTNPQTRQSKSKQQKQFDSKVQELVSLANKLPPSKPSPEDLRFRKTLNKAMKLSVALEPALNGIYHHLTDVLQNETDRELFRLYPLLQMGATLSQYSPHRLVKTDLTFGDYIKLYTTWAKKAERLLQAMEKGETITEPAAVRKGQKQAATVARATGK